MHTTAEVRVLVASNTMYKQLKSGSLLPAKPHTHTHMHTTARVRVLVASNTTWVQTAEIRVLTNEVRVLVACNLSLIHI